MSNVETIHFDGTFKSVPKGYAQLLLVHAYVHQHMYACVFILLPNKEAITYIEPLATLKRLIEVQPVQMCAKVSK